MVRGVDVKNFQNFFRSLRMEDTLNPIFLRSDLRPNKFGREPDYSPYQNMKPDSTDSSEYRLMPVSRDATYEIVEKGFQPCPFMQKMPCYSVLLPSTRASRKRY